MTADYPGADRRQGAAPASLMPWWVLPGLATFVLAIFAGALAASLFMKNETLQTQMFTQAALLAALVAGFFFGSSVGKAKQDDALAATAIKQNETIAAQGVALATSAPVPPTVTTTTIDPGPPATATTTTAPAEPRS